MIKHVVMWKLKDEFEGKTKTDLALELYKRLMALKETIPEIIQIEVGINFNESKAAGDVVLYTKFQDMLSLQSYQQHPDHLAVAAFIQQIVLARSVVDYEV